MLGGHDKTDGSCSSRWFLWGWGAKRCNCLSSVRWHSPAHVSVSPSLLLSVTLFLSLCVCHSLSVSVCLCLCLSLSLLQSQSVSLSLSPSLSPSLSLTMSLSLPLFSLSLSPFLSLSLSDSAPASGSDIPNRCTGLLDEVQPHRASHSASTAPWWNPCGHQKRAPLVSDPTHRTPYVLLLCKMPRDGVLCVILMCMHQNPKKKNQHNEVFCA